MLNAISTRAPKEFDKSQTKEDTLRIKERLEALQDVLYADGNRAVLVVIQGMDGSGKDGAIKNVFGGLNPQGISVTSFKTPTAEELAHDFLWRVHRHAPEKGSIKIFNRSHYEDVLITRVHGWCDNDTAKKRFEAINDFEALLIKHNNTTILKFYLHVSPEEQEERLKERVTNMEKHWKYNSNDFEERKLWPKYMEMYEDVFRQCNNIPWTIVPADQNWYKEYLIAKTVTDTLEGLNLQYPALKKGHKAALCERYFRSTTKTNFFMGFVKEFREFALKGNVVDLAIAVIIGAAFGAIVSSLVDDVITPLILQPALDAAGVKDLDKLAWGAVKYGNFLAAILKFIVIALVLFMLIKGMNSLKRKKEEPVADAPPVYSLQEKLLMEIRDSLRK